MQGLATGGEGVVNKAGSTPRGGRVTLEGRRPRRDKAVMPAAIRIAPRRTAGISCSNITCTFPRILVVLSIFVLLSILVFFVHGNFLVQKFEISRRPPPSIKVKEAAGRFPEQQ